MILSSRKSLPQYSGSGDSEQNQPSPGLGSIPSTSVRATSQENRSRYHSLHENHSDSDSDTNSLEEMQIVEDTPADLLTVILQKILDNDPSFDAAVGSWDVISDYIAVCG